jgi:hypothetical protein
VAVAGNYAYLAEFYTGLRVIDVSNPSAPVLAGYAPAPYLGHGVAVEGGCAYVADAGLQVFDVSSPTAPAVIGRGDAPDYTFGVAVANGLAFVASEYAGLFIFPLQCLSPAALGEAGPAPALRLAAWPNPARGRTSISFDGAGPASLRIVDAGGRLVRTLVKGGAGPAAMEVEWDGTDAAGRRVPAGVYFVELRAHGAAAARKLVLLD